MKPSGGLLRSDVSHGLRVSVTAIIAVLLAALAGIALAQSALPTLPTSAEINEISSTTASLPPPAPLTGGTVETLTTDAGGVANLKRSDFVRGIWVDAKGPTLKSASGIKQLVENCRKAGFNTIYAQVRANGDALYKTTLAPMPQDVPKDFDPLATLIQEAKAGDKPLQVHAWMVVYRVWGSRSGQAPTQHVVTKNADWLTQTDDGSKEVGDYNDELWLDPGVTEVQDHMELIVTDMAKSYAVDGVQLDRIRYAGTKAITGEKNNQRTGYNPAAVERYNKEKKKSGTPKPEDAEWIAWRRDQVSETVRRMRDATKAVRANAVFSAGSIAFGLPPNTKEEYTALSDTYNYNLQDWVGWCEKGLLDVNVLMDYKAFDKRPADFEGWMRFALENKGKAKVVIGVAGWLNPPEQAMAMMLEPIFSPAADGVGLYGYHEPFKGPLTSVDFGVFRQVFDETALGPKAKDIAAVMSTNPPTGEARIANLAQFVGGLKPAAPAPTPAPAVASPAPSALPVLSPDMAAAPEKTAAATPRNLSAALPNLPGSPASSADVPPPLPPASTSRAAALPDLPGASASSSSADFPSLPGSSPAPATGSTLPSLPSLDAAGSPTGSTADGSRSAASGLPPLSAALEPGAATGGIAAQLPDLPGSTRATEGPTTNKTETTERRETVSKTGVESLPSLPGAGVPATGIVQSETRTQVTAVGTPHPAVAVERRVLATQTPMFLDARKEVVRYLEPTPSRTTVAIPDYGSMTNYNAEVMVDVTPVPKFEAPSVLTPEAVAPGQFPELPLAREKPLAAPVVIRPDYSDPHSPYGTPVAPSTIRNYAGTITKKTPVIAMPSSGAAPLQVIVLTNGKEFAGRVIQRGAIWKIELPNGSILNMPGNRVATVRVGPTQSLDVVTQ